MTPSDARFVLLVPVKASADAKSRLGLEVEQRLALRHAFALDAVAAARACPLVDTYVVGAGAGLGVPELPDEGDGDLNAALDRAAASVATSASGVAALLADLPCLRPDDLITALLEAAAHPGRSFVADAQGTGTTLLVATPGVPLDPRFGAGSAAAHAASGARAVTAEVPTLRRDVDTPDDLAAAIALGVGPRTAQLVADRSTG